MVLVFVENVEGKFKKSAFEAVSFGFAIASKVGSSVVALSIGNVTEDELKKLGQYGATKVLSATDVKLKTMNVLPYSTVIAEAAKQEGAKVVIMSAGFSGKGI